MDWTDASEKARTGADVTESDASAKARELAQSQPLNGKEYNDKVPLGGQNPVQLNCTLAALRWRGRRDSNPQPPDRQSGTLTN